MRLSFKTAGQETDWPSLLDMWTEADQIEAYDAGWVFDHLTPIFSDPAGPCFEGWSLLAALAVRTTRLRMGAMVSSNTHRHPAVLASMAATIDVLSSGRLEIGIGAGWNEYEHDAYGIRLPPLKERFDRLEEAIEVIHLLLTQQRSSFAGVHYRLQDAHCEPKPIQTPRPPFVVGGKGEKRTLRIAARWADQWNYPGDDAEEFHHKVEVLWRHCAEVGRDPAEIEVSAQFRALTPAETAAKAAELTAAGAQHLILYLAPPFDPGTLAPIAAAVTDAAG